MEINQISIIFFSFSIDESRTFTIDAMLNNNGKNLNKENAQQQQQQRGMYQKREIINDHFCDNLLGFVIN